jgi:ATP-dependent Clp protease ATP-binding subunit ClpA
MQFAAEFQEKHPGASPELALLSGILQEGTNVAAMALRLRRADCARISELADNFDFSPPQSKREPERPKGIDSYLSKAWEEANRLNHGYIGPEHILFALTATATGIAVLQQMKVEAAAVKETTVYLLNERS